MAIGYNQVVIAFSPIDVNLAKQLNILLGILECLRRGFLSIPPRADWATGLEYSYSVMERDRMAALTQEDVKLQAPIICNLANEVWENQGSQGKERRQP